MNIYSPLVKKYFRLHLDHLVKAQATSILKNGKFVRYADDSTQLEARLERIEPLGLTGLILAEVNDADPVVLDRRLVDAWAELRVVDQLHKEGFTNLNKVIQTADLTGMKDGQNYAFQVKRITTSLQDEFNSARYRRQVANDPNMRRQSPYGDTIDIHMRFDENVSFFFWDALSEKNRKFKNWPSDGDIRCIVIVSGDASLQDNMVRHISCQQIRSGIYHSDLTPLNFDELLWLPDISNGAWFKLGTSEKETRCFADWQDTPGLLFNDHRSNRREMDLDGDAPAWKLEDQAFRKQKSE